MLRKMDSFDHYATADISKKWQAVSASPSISAGNGRNSTASLRGVNWNDGLDETFDNQATWVIGMAFRMAEIPTAFRGIVMLYDALTAQVSLGVNTSGRLIVARGIESGTLLATGSTVLSTNTYYYIEFYTTIHNTAGVVKVRINGTAETLTFVTGTETTQDTQASANAYANILSIHSYSGSGQIIDRDDLYVLDGQDGTATQGAPNNDFLGDVRCEALFPNGNGAHSDFDGSDGNQTDNYLLVDDPTANNDTDYVSSLTSGDIDTYAMTNLTPTSGSIIGVQTNLWMRKDDAGTRQVAPVFRISSTDYAGTAVNATDTYLDQRQIYGKSPASGSAWTVSEVNGLEFGPKVP